MSTCRPRHTSPLSDPESIFVLRNNDIGDLLVVTPLFEALRKLYPASRIVTGVGGWNVPVLAGNPHLSEVLELNAPWHNQQVCRHPDLSARGAATAARYLISSPDVARLRAMRCDIGIDVLGSAQGSLLFLRAGIPYRLGVSGYAGGDAAAQQTVRFDDREHVGRAALRFAELLGATELPENRPQLFLDEVERAAGRRLWDAQESPHATKPRRIVIAPGGGFLAKRWPIDRFEAVTRTLAADPDVEMIVIGGQADAAAGERLAATGVRVRNLAGALPLRSTFAVVAAADLVVCNSSMAMHVAAAFARPAVVVLGTVFESASQHAAQWAYPETVVLGKEPGRRATLHEPEDVLAAIRHTLVAGEQQCR